MNHCFEICHYQQNVPQHYYLLDTLVYWNKLYDLRNLVGLPVWFVGPHSIDVEYGLSGLRSCDQGTSTGTVV